MTTPLSVEGALYTAEWLPGEYWVVHQGGAMSRINPRTDQVTTYQYGEGDLHYENGPNETNQVIPFHDNKNGFWAQAILPDMDQSFLLHYELSSGSFQFYDLAFNMPGNPSLPNGWLGFANIVDRTGLWWIGASPGLYKQAPKNRQMDLFRFDPDDPNSLPSDNIRSIFEDSQHRIWVGTDKGLALYQADKKEFLSYQHQPKAPNSLSHNHITYIHEDAEGGLWIGTENGLNLWQEDNQSFKRFFVTGEGKNLCQFIYTDRENRLWVAMDTEGVLELSPGTGKIRKQFSRLWLPFRGQNFLVTAMVQDAQNNFWVGTRRDGLHRLNEEESAFIPYLPIPEDEYSISSTQIRGMIVDAKDRLWIGTNLGGVNRFDHTQNQFIRYASSQGYRLGTILDFVLDQEGSLWLSTYSNLGLLKWDEKTGDFIRYNEEKGLLLNDLYFEMPNLELAKDDAGRFYIPTKRGLSVFDPKTGSFSSYFEKDGFQAYSQEGYYEIKTKNGDIWIGGQHGLNRIVPEDLLEKDSTVANLIITGMSINDSLYAKPDGEIFEKAVSYTDRVKLKHWQKDLAFEFVYLHYLRSEDNLYSWRLKNYNDTWSAPSKERRASLTNLSPGTYEFQVKGANSDGIWKEEWTSLSITIAPPWWQTIWAYFGYLLLVGLITWLLIRWRTHALRRQREELRARVNEQTQELKESNEQMRIAKAEAEDANAAKSNFLSFVSHELRTPLTSIIGFANLNKRRLEEKLFPLIPKTDKKVERTMNQVSQNNAVIVQEGQRLAELINNLLDLAKIESGKVEWNIQSIVPKDLVARAEAASQGLFTERPELAFVSEVSADLPVFQGDFDRLLQVLLNLISNAVKFTESGTISLLVGQNAQAQLQFAVQDTGAGIPAEYLNKVFERFQQVEDQQTGKPKGTGLGLPICKEIVEYHGGKIWVKSTANFSQKTSVGSTFYFTIPVESQSLKPQENG